jgi:hypothetical protein
MLLRMPNLNSEDTRLWCANNYLDLFLGSPRPPPLPGQLFSITALCEAASLISVRHLSYLLDIYNKRAIEHHSVPFSGAKKRV